MSVIIRDATNSAQLATVDSNNNLHVLEGGNPQDVVSTGTVSANATGVSISTQGAGEVIFNVTGTWVGTFTPQAQLPDGSWVNTTVFPTLPAGVSVSTISANGQWKVATGGWAAFRLQATAWTSGTATINLEASQRQSFTAALVKGATGATLDGTAVTPATAPTNGVATLVVNETTAPSLTNGQSVGVQGDYVGNIFTRPFRRSQTVAQSSVINASTSPVTCLAAQGAGIFADISTFVLTITAAATTDLGFTVTLSDGTASYVFDLNTGSLGTGTGDPNNPLVLLLPVPLPATSANTAWTITSSVSTGVVVHCMVIAVLQKAS